MSDSAVLPSCTSFYLLPWVPECGDQQPCRSRVSSAAGQRSSVGVSQLMCSRERGWRVQGPVCPQPLLTGQSWPWMAAVAQSECLLLPSRALHSLSREHCQEDSSAVWQMAVPSIGSPLWCTDCTALQITAAGWLAGVPQHLSPTCRGTPALLLQSQPQQQRQQPKPFFLPNFTSWLGGLQGQTWAAQCLCSQKRWG